MLHKEKVEIKETACEDAGVVDKNSMKNQHIFKKHKNEHTRTHTHSPTHTLCDPLQWGKWMGVTTVAILADE